MAGGKPKPTQDDKGRFVAGNGGNGGRSKGSRNKLGEAFIADMFADWEQHGAATIEAVRTEKPDQYLKVVASILPKDLNVNINNMDDLTDDEILERIRSLDAAIRPLLDAERASVAVDGDKAQTAH